MKPMNYLYTSVPVLSLIRKQLEVRAVNAICACWYCDLISSLGRMKNTDLIRIIEREPCIACE